MYFSYVMGIDESIYGLQQIGFVIDKDDYNNYMVSFPEDKAEEWENFISKKLERGYWNEYLANRDVVFMFHLDDGIKRYVVNNYQNTEVLHLCEKLCECKFESIKAMLVDNHFYKGKII